MHFIDLSEATRARVAKLARSARTRQLGSLPDRPHKWHPETVQDPRWNAPFTKASAWEFVADKIEEGHPVEEILMEKPLGARGLVLHVVLPPNPSALYIKFELIGNLLLGRSFHLSIFE